jgi:protein-S-isoprenylcysteine O-methyltransferase Ste14
MLFADASRPVNSGVMLLNRLLFSLFQFSWAFVWAAKHFEIRHRRAYSKQRTQTDRNPRYKVISVFLFVVQNVLCIAAFWSNSQLLFKIHDNDLIRVFGVLVITVATALYFRSLGYLGRNYSPCFDSYVPFELITRGPYRFTRHPMYLAKLVVVVGNLLLSGSLWFVIMFVYLLAETIATIIKEERYLMSSFPTYANYRRRTTMMLPFIF